MLHSRHELNLKILATNIKIDNFLMKYIDVETSVAPCTPGTGDTSQR